MAETTSVFKIVASVVGADAIEELSKSLEKVSTRGEGLKRSLAAGALALKAFAAAESVNALREWIAGTIELGAHLQDLSESTGVSVKTLAMLKPEADEAGIGIDGVAKGVEKLDKAMILAKEGTGSQAEAFKQLGLSAADINPKFHSVDEIILKVADSFHKHADGADKTAIAIELFGKAGADLIPILNKGGEEIQKHGLAMDNAFGEKAKQYSENITEIKTQFSNMGIKLASELLPGLSMVAKSFADNEVLTNAVVTAVRLLETAYVGLEATGGEAIDAITEKLLKSYLFLEKYAALAKDVFTFNFSEIKSDTAKFDAENKFLDQEMQRRFDERIKSASDRIKEIWNPTQKSASEDVHESMNSKPNYNFNPTRAAANNEATKALNKWIETLKQENATLAQESDYIGKSTLEIAQMKEARKIDAQFAEKTVGMSPEIVAKYKQEAEAIKAARMEIEKKNYEESRSATTGAKNFLTKSIEDWTNYAQQVQTVMGDAFKGLEDGMVSWITTGKMSFSKMADSIISDIARIMIQQTIELPIATALKSALGAGSIASVFGFANGGIMSSNGALPLHSYASGGIADRPQLALFGEGRMNEAYVPLPDGRSIPVSMKNGGGNQQQNNISVTVNMGENSQQTTASGSNDARNMGVLIASAVKNILVNEKRPGGLLAT